MGVQRRKAKEKRRLSRRIEGIPWENQEEKCFKKEVIGDSLAVQRLGLCACAM